MTPEVAQAVQELKAGFPGTAVTATEVGDGGAHVVIEPVDLGDAYEQRETWVGFTISFQYPYADIYPLFIRPDLVRVDQAHLGEGISTGHSFEGRQATQLSRRSNRLNPAIDTAVLKVTKVLAWLR